MNGWTRHRDLLIFPLPGARSLVITCDSCGGVGDKPGDAFPCPPETVGALTARTALLELLCVGATPLCLIDNLCCELHPTGARILAGIRAELARAGLDIPVTGSTEENFTVDTTCIGMTAIGSGELRTDPVRAGDRALLIGRPLLGRQVLERPDDLASYDDVRALLASPDVRELVPVGSRGIAAEARELAALYGLVFEPAIGLASASEPAVDLAQSGGPSTCVLAAARPDAANHYSNILEIGSFQGIAP